MKAYPTTFQGIRYRSRLEAKWAAFFDLIGWRHTYEPFDANGYIPDFVIHGPNHPLLVEVKPAVTEDDYREAIPKVTNGLRGHWKHGVLIVGVQPVCITNHGTASAGWITPSIGWKFISDTWWCDDGDGHTVLAGNTYQRKDRDWVDEQWAAATNKVQWKGKTA